MEDNVQKPIRIAPTSPTTVRRPRNLTYLLFFSFQPIQFIQSHKQLLNNYKAVNKVLELKCENSFKKDLNEVMALKVHYLTYILKKCKKCEDDGKEGMAGLIKV